MGHQVAEQFANLTGAQSSIIYPFWTVQNDPYRQAGELRGALREAESRKTGELRRRLGFFSEASVKFELSQNTHAM